MPAGAVVQNGTKGTSGMDVPVGFAEDIVAKGTTGTGANAKYAAIQGPMNIMRTGSVKTAAQDK